MILKKYIKVFDNVLPLNTISSLIKYLNKEYESNSFYDGGIGYSKTQNINKEIRNVQIFDFQYMSQSLTNVHYNNLLCNVILSHMHIYKKDFEFLHGINHINQLSALRYTEGGHYVYHVDDGAGFNRILSAILILNNDYEDGELCFKLGDEEMIIKPSPSKLILWPSNFLFPHCVKSIKKGIRYSVVAWAQ